MELLCLEIEVDIHPAVFISKCLIQGGQPLLTVKNDLGESPKTIAPVLFVTGESPLLFLTVENDFGDSPVFFLTVKNDLGDRQITT